MSCCGNYILASENSNQQGETFHWPEARSVVTHQGFWLHLNVVWNKYQIYRSICILQRMFNPWGLSSLLCDSRNMEKQVKLFVKGTSPRSSKEIVLRYYKWISDTDDVWSRQLVFCLAAESTGSVPTVHDQGSANRGQLCLFLLSNSLDRMPLLIFILCLSGLPEWKSFTLGAVLTPPPVLFQAPVLWDCSATVISVGRTFSWCSSLIWNSEFLFKTLSNSFCKILLLEMCLTVTEAEDTKRSCTEELLTVKMRFHCLPFEQEISVWQGRWLLSESGVSFQKDALSVH